jgi:ABC-2 type transport system permease protein
MRAFAKLTLVEFKLLIREPAALFFLLAFPLILLFLNGGYGNEPDERFGGVGAMDVLVPGYVAMILATAGLTALPGILASYRERGVLRRLGATPLPPATVLAAQVVVQLALSTAGLVVLLVVGMLAYDLNPPAAPAAFAGAFLLGGLAVLALGFVVASLARSARIAAAAGFVVFFPMIFLSGAAVPRESLTATMQRIADALPLTYVVTALRDAWAGAPASMLAFGVLAATLGAGALVGARTFRWE